MKEGFLYSCLVFPPLYVRKCSVAKSCPAVCDPMDLQPTRLLCPWVSPDKNTGVGLPFPSPGDIPRPGIEPKSPMSLALTGGFFTTEPPRKLFSSLQLNNFPLLVDSFCPEPHD